MNYTLSVLTACFVGVVIALGIMKSSALIFDSLTHQRTITIDLSEKANSQTNGVTATSAVKKAASTSLDGAEIDEEDPYSVIESAMDSLPHQQKAAIVGASAYIVIDASTGSVLNERLPDKALPIASITKLVTAMTARKVFDPDQRIEITARDLATEGNTGRLRLGEKFKVNEILYPLLMTSSNDAAEAIANAYGRRQFILAMNDWAASIGAYHTYFRDPSGLSSQNVASARDLALILQWIATHEPDVLDITHTKTKTVRTHTWTNATHFLNLNTYRGGKNGFTDEAGRTGASVFETKDSLGKSHVYIIVVLNSKNRDNDVLALLQKATVQ
jgi:D-alanyl-D-alanine carboxypeptidase